MSNKAEQAERVADALYTIKWVLIGLTALCAVVAAGAVALQDNSPSYAVTIAVVIVMATAVWSLFVWVLFGWFEHTLRMLLAIAVNTSHVQQRM